MTSFSGGFPTKLIQIDDRSSVNYLNQFQNSFAPQRLLHFWEKRQRDSGREDDCACSETAAEIVHENKTA
jgi:hypothetical protein